MSLAPPSVPPVDAAPPAGSSPALRHPARTRWLDGVRGAAALFVVLHHMWLATWPYFPQDRGPWWLGWLLYGHLAVAVFIVVSGYSLALAPRRHGGELVGGTRRFLRRRAWRILPAYWAALILSSALFALVLHPETSSGTVARSFVIHAVLAQDLIGNVPTNGTFWSIAIEWQIYFVFPLVLLVARRRHMAVAAALTLGAVIGAHELAASGRSPFDKIDHVGPQFLALFAFGVLAAFAGVTTPRRGIRVLTAALAAAAVVAVVMLGRVQGSPWMASHWFWIDLLFGAAVASALYLTAAAPHRGPGRLLASRPAVVLGSFSYSLYLMHAPVLELLHREMVAPLRLAPLASFALLIAVVLPVVLLVCFAFFRLFERPFLQRRSLGALRGLPIWTFVVWVARRATAAPAAASDEAA